MLRPKTAKIRANKSTTCKIPGTKNSDDWGGSKFKYHGGSKLDCQKQKVLLGALNQLEYGIEEEPSEAGGVKQLRQE